MNHDQKVPPEGVLMHLLMGKFLAMGTTVAANLGIADQLANGPKTAKEIADNVSATEDGVYRLMRALSTAGVFEERANRSFALTPVSEILRSDVKGSMRAMAQWICEPLAWEAWNHLEHSVRTGKPGLDVMGAGANTFEFLARHPKTLEVFQNAMTSFSAMTGHAVAEAYDFSKIGKLIDVGGGHGAMLSAILEKNPSVKGVLFDLPEVIEKSKGAVAQRGMDKRIECVAGSFFDGVPGPADAFIMKHIIHDWDDARSTKILEGCRKQLSKDGKVLVVDQVVSDRPESVPAKLLDLEMLVMTPGGRERTEAEFTALFAKAGLRLTKIVPTKSPVCVIEGVPA